MTLEDISALGEKYAKLLNPGSVAPFPYESVMAQQPDLEVHITELEDKAVSGIIFYKDERFTILVNATKPEARQNFTVGHELGHYFLHQEVLKAEKGIIDGDVWLDEPHMLYRADGIRATQLEQEANKFAASLLMPAALVRRAWRVMGDVEECANLFRVSIVAMSKRLAELKLAS